MAIKQKTPHQVLTEKLAELSADIPAKVGKQARDTAISIARNMVNTAKSKIMAEFDQWVDKGLIKTVPDNLKQIYENYVTAGAAMEAHLKTVGPSNNYENAMSDFYLIGLSQFLTGYRYTTRDTHRTAIEVYRAKIKGYPARKAAVEAQIAELEHMMEDVRISMFRSYKNRTAATNSGVDLGIAVADLMKIALGHNLLAAPKAVECELVLQDVG